MLFADNVGPDQPAQAQADQGLRCPDTESVDTEIYVDEEKVPRIDCTDAVVWIYSVFKMHKSFFYALQIIMYVV